MFLKIYTLSSFLSLLIAQQTTNSILFPFHLVPSVPHAAPASQTLSIPSFPIPSHPFPSPPHATPVSHTLLTPFFPLPSHPFPSLPSLMQLQSLKLYSSLPFPSYFIPSHHIPYFPFPYQKHRIPTLKWETLEYESKCMDKIAQRRRNNNHILTPFPQTHIQ